MMTTLHKLQQFSCLMFFRSEFPDFGSLFLATLYETCPFLIPCFFGRQSGTTDEEYYKKLGYNYDSANKVEDQVILWYLIVLCAVSNRFRCNPGEPSPVRFEHLTPFIYSLGVI